MAKKYLFYKLKFVCVFLLLSSAFNHKLYIFDYMIAHFYKYEGCGNDFIVIDNRSLKYKFDEKSIKKFCHRRFGIGADGLILIEEDKLSAFYMNFFNSDGKGATLCGNGGRCAVAFWEKLNPSISKKISFRAIDGIHKAFVKENHIYLEIKEVKEAHSLNKEFFLDTGSPHFIKFVENVTKLNVYEEGKKIRYSPTYCKEGINVNFVQIIDSNTLKVRTYERGVENETLSCGTGVSAAAIAAFELKKINSNKVDVHTKGGKLSVHFDKKNKVYKNIWLIGEAKLVFEGFLSI